MPNYVECGGRKAVPSLLTPQFAGCRSTASGTELPVLQT